MMDVLVNYKELKGQANDRETWKWLQKNSIRLCTIEENILFTIILCFILTKAYSRN